MLVVGGGAAGCVVATRLSEDPSCRVVLIEAGPDLRESPPDDVRLGWQPTRSFDWGYTSEPDEAGVTRALPRGRLLGGCSSTNATFALRGSPADYDGWASSGNPGWSFSDVLPSFTRLERDLDFGDRPWHGSAGPVPIRRYRPGELSDVAAASLAGFAGMGITPVEDHNAPGAVGAGLLPVNCLDGIRLSAAHTYLPRPGDRPNLAIRCDCEVVDLVVERGRALGVRLAGGEIVHAGCVVLSSGAYGSPLLLLRSGIGPASQLSDLGITISADLAGVGANLADHTAVALASPHAPDPAPAPLAQAVATLHSSQAVAGSPPDLQLIAFVPDTPVGAAPATFRVVAALLKPRSRGRISLRSGRATEAPRIDLGTFREPCDLERLEEGLELAEGLAAQPELRLLGKGGPRRRRAPGRADRRDWMRRSCWTYHHPVGTCRMGAASDPSAVVDECGRVHGIDRLRIADASVMPDIPSANTHIPTLMVAERLAELIRGQNARG